jgi:nucleotide-binding universal stress UspA family protein
MISIKRILFPTDFSACAEQAFIVADQMAKRYGAELHVLHVIVWSGADLNPGMLYGLPQSEQERLLENVRGHISERIERAIPENRPYPYKLAEMTDSSSAAAIVSYVDDHDIDLVVMGTHGHHRLKRLLLGSTAERVVRLAKCPVLTVRESSKVEDYAPRRILLPVDFSDQTESLLRHALHVAADENAEIDIVHVVPPQYLPAIYYGADPLPVPYDEIRKRTMAHLKEVIADVIGTSVRTRPFVVVGDPVTEIIEMASKSEYDLLIVSTHGYSGIKHALVGSVAERVVRSASCPVLVTKTFGHSILNTSITVTSAEA